MPAGAGAATVAWAAEDSYLGGTSSPTYYLPGTNVQIQTAEFNRNQARIRLPSNREDADFVTQQLRGQLGMQFVLTDDNFHRLVFNSGFTGFTDGLANSAEWYLGADLTSGNTVERQMQGWVPGNCEVNYNGSTELVTVTLSGPYGDEQENTSLTPGTIVNNKGSEVPGHGATLKINGTRVAELQSASITLSELSRLITDSNTPKPVGAVGGPVQQSASLSAIYDGPDLYEIALGASSATSLQDFADAASFTVEFDRDGTVIADYTFDTIKPERYSWEDLVQADPALGESIDFNATLMTASDPTV